MRPNFDNERDEALANQLQTDAAEDFATEAEDLDVDAPEGGEAEDTVAEGTDVAPKAEKAKKEPARPPVPEGFISPVKFAKVLTEHLRSKGKLTAEQEVRPQVVYSYIKNNGADSKHPFPTHSAEGRAVVLKADEAVAWWDAKDERVAAGKVARAEKAKAKAEKDAAKPESAEGTDSNEPVVEAE